MDGDGSGDGLGAGAFPPDDRFLPVFPWLAVVTRGLASLSTNILHRRESDVLRIMIAYSVIFNRMWR